MHIYIILQTIFLFTFKKLRTITMIKSIYFFATVLLLCYTLNSTFIQQTVAFSSINLTSVITTQTICQHHVVFNNISTSDLPTTRDIPIALTKRSLSDDFFRNVGSEQVSTTSYLTFSEIKVGVAKLSFSLSL